MAKKSKAGKSMRLGVMIGILICIGVAGFYLYPKYQAWIGMRSAGEHILLFDENISVPLYIPTGSTAQDVANLMVEEEMIADTDKFLMIAAKLNYGGGNVVPGLYMIDGAWTIKELIIALRQGRERKEVQITTDGVHTIEELAGQVSRSLEIDSAQLIDYLTSEELLSYYGLNRETIITLFFPNKYNTNWAITKEELVEQFAGYYREFWTEERKQKAREMGYSQSQIITLASIVYGESGAISSEWPVVAGLYINRLKKGIKLQSDPTAKFASGDYDAQRIYHKHTKLEHPYNTYYITGLPPGPISPVPAGVVDAVLNYSQHSYLYMCAKPGNIKGHTFATTLAEHNRNANAYHRYLNQKDIR